MTGTKAATTGRPDLSLRKRSIQARAEDTRRKIIAAAIREFSYHSFDGANLSRVSTDAGVSNSLLRYHFPTKMSLWYACADDLFGAFGQDLRDLFASSEPGYALIRKVFVLHLHAYLKRPEMMRFSQSYRERALERREYIFGRHLSGLHENLVESAKIAQEQGLFPRGDPDVLLAFMLGAIVNIGNNKHEIERFLGKKLDAPRIEEFEEVINRLFLLADAV